MPITLKIANAYIAEHHRHNNPLPAGVCVVGVADDDRLCGVAIIGRPVARMLDDGQRDRSMTRSRAPHRPRASPLTGRARIPVHPHLPPARRHPVSRTPQPS